MKRIARAVVALALVAFAAPVLACGFEKSHTTTTAVPAPAQSIAKAEKQKEAKGLKAEKGKDAKAPRGSAAN